MNRGGEDAIKFNTFRIFKEMLHNMNAANQFSWRGRPVVVWQT
jgi:hypothetical protein